MATFGNPSIRTGLLKDPYLKEKLQELRQTDNWTNWLYVGRTYLIIVLALGTAVWLHQWQAMRDLHLLWNVPVFFLAIIIVGASQHQLAGATHEATHYILFRNRLLNELVSDWLCMFPLFSSTYIFRLHHLAHHQFINDPDRDPDFSQLKLSGHLQQFPLGKKQFLSLLLRQAWLPNLVRYMLVRARYNAIGVSNNPYQDQNRDISPWPLRVTMAYLGGLLLLMNGALWLASPLLLSTIPLASFIAVTCFFLSIPKQRYATSRLRPVIAARTTLISRIAYLTLLFTALCWAEFLTGLPVRGYFLGLWVLPLFSTFAFFMILRQLVQHGNGDRGWLTNTRIFLVNPFIRYAVFPYGMDYHLPHHMFATIPHYRLPALHAFLMEQPDYAQQGIVVEGYFFPRHHHPNRNPTVVEVLGPEYSQQDHEVFIDDSVLEVSELEARPEA